MSTSPNERIAIGIDVGGTAIKYGLLDFSGRLIELERRKTPSHAPPGEIADDLVAMIAELCEKGGVGLDDLEGVGVSLAGFITADGVVTATAHLSPQWVGFDLKSRLQKDIQSDFYFALDTPAPTLGEAYYGAGRGFDNFVYVTVSTGIGAGIVADGEYFIGGMGWAGGVGHTIVDENHDLVCEGCGNAGCLETFAATQGILHTAEKVLRSYPGSLMLKRVDAGKWDITPETIYQAALQGDPAALEIWHRVGHALGIGLVNLIDILAPSRVVIGGGISQAGDFLLNPAREVIRERAFPPQLRTVEVVQAELGDLSGVYGAAAMVFHQLRINIEEEPTL